MTLETLMLDFAQAVGGVSKQTKDLWILEIPVDEERSRVVFFRLNIHPTEDGGQESLLAFFTQIGDQKTESLRQLLKLSADLRYSRLAILDNDLVLLAIAPETFTEATMLDMLHELVWAGERFTDELTRIEVQK